jgi:glycosyltransferase involved in cell wall biosynthesis
LKILEVTHYMPPHSGGIERVTSSLCDGLRRRGHDVRWIASAAGSTPGDAGAAVRIRAWNVLEDTLGVPYPLWGPAGLRRLSSLIRWADVVHAHDCLYMGSAAAAFWCRRLRKPLLLTQHVAQVPFGPVLDLMQRIAYETLGRMVVGAVDRAVVCSAHVPESLAKMGIRRRFELVPNAVDLGRFAIADAARKHRARSNCGLRDDERVLLFVGRLVPKKGVPDLCAMQSVLGAEGIRLLVVGDGPLAGELTRVPGVLHIPAVAPSEMPEVYAAADAFVLPSRGEGLPLSVQEAMTQGLRVVVSDDPSFTRNLAGAPGVTFAPDRKTLLRETRAALVAQPSPGPISAWARERWGPERFVGEYERILGELRTASEKEAA